MGLLTKIQLWLTTHLIALLVGLALGGAAVVLWDHKAPFGLGLAQRLDGANAALDKAQGDLKTCRADVNSLVGKTWEWKRVYDRLQALRESESKAAATALAARSALMQRQCAAAFDAGVTAGRALGPNTQGDNDADQDSGASSAHAGADGLHDDFRSAWRSGAFRAAPGDR